MQPQAFLDLAERLIAAEKNPEGFRTAISRAYYGAFLQAEDFLRRMNVFAVTDKKHQEGLQILTELNGCRIIPTRFHAVAAKIQAEVKRLRGLP